MNAFQALVKAHTNAAGQKPDEHCKNWLFDIAWRLEQAYKDGSRKDVADELKFIAGLFKKAAAAIKLEAGAIQLDRPDLEQLRERPIVRLLSASLFSRIDISL